MFNLNSLRADEVAGIEFRVWHVAARIQRSSWHVWGTSHLDEEIEREPLHIGAAAFGLSKAQLMPKSSANARSCVLVV